MLFKQSTLSHPLFMPSKAVLLVNLTSLKDIGDFIQCSPVAGESLCMNTRVLVITEASLELVEVDWKFNSEF